MMTRSERTLQKEKEEQDALKKEKRKKYIKKSIAICLVLIFIITGIVYYSRYIGTSGLIVKEYKVVNEKIPEEFYGLKIIQFSDLHYGSTIEKKELENLVKKINSLHPDLIFFTGDLIDKDTKVTEDVVEEVTSSLKEMNAKMGKYAVSGNHDYLYEGFQSIMKNSNFKYLDNDYDLVYYQGYNPILIVGSSDSGQHQADFEKSYRYFTEEGSNPDIYTIALFHEPDDITTIRTKHEVDLALAGHSHNGQVRLPFLPPLKTVKGARKYNEPYYKVGTTELYISSGLGTSNYKFRLFNRPSINFYRLRNH